MARSRKKEEPRPTHRACDHAGCAEHADYRAPKSRDPRPDYHWFCLDHVRDYNKGWNYFDGMGTDEIEAFMHEAVTGHRPTWYMSGNLGHHATARMHDARLHAAFDAYMHRETAWHPHPVPPIEPAHRKALHELELGHPSERADVKRQYKQLAKQYHPDINPGDKDAEERFKRITQAYRLLTKEYLSKDMHRGMAEP